MRTKKIILTIDLFIQVFIFLPVIFSSITALVAGDALIFGYFLGILVLGSWQLLSGFLHGVINKDRNRLNYVFFSVVYLFCLYSGTLLVADLNFTKIINTILFIVFFGIVPLSIAIWYLRYTSLQLKKLDTDNKTIDTHFPNLENILDSDEVLKP